MEGINEYKSIAAKTSTVANFYVNGSLYALAGFVIISILLTLLKDSSCLKRSIIIQFIEGVISISVIFIIPILFVAIGVRHAASKE